LLKLLPVHFRNASHKHNFTSDALNNHVASHKHNFTSDALNNHVATVASSNLY